MKTTKYLLLMLLTLLGAKGLNAQTKEAYAYLSEDGKTLAFYYNGDRSSIRTGTTYGMNTGTNSPNWNAKASNITTVIFDQSFADYYPTTCYSWFRNCSNIDFRSVYNLQNLNTDQVTDMSFMFTNCTSLTNFNLSHFDTSNVTSMKNMFSNCTSLESLNLSHFDTSNVTDMSYMFAYCSSLTSLDVSNFDTSNVTDIYNMFYVCSSLTSLDVSNFDTSNVIYMSGMFASCTSLESLDVSNFDTSNVTDMDYMFMSCSSLTSLDLSSFIFNQSSNNNFAYDCSSLKTLTVPATANFLNSTAFNYVGTKEAPCTLFYPEDFTPSGTSNYDSYFKWKGGYFKEAEPEPYATLNGSTLTFYYDRYRSNRTGKTFDIKTSYTYPAWYTIASNITTVVFDPSFANYHPTTCFGWFCNFKKISNISELQYLNTDQVTDMFDMFYGCSSLTSLDLSGFKTENVTRMDYMFEGCSSLESLDLSGFNTSKVTNMYYMFKECSSLTSLDLSNFVFSSTGNDYLLSGCSGLKTLTIPATAYLLGSNACTGVGSETAPCVLVYPDGFTLETDDTGEGWFKWKGGYFKDGPKAYAVLNGSTLTFYYDGNRSNYTTTYDLNTESNAPEWNSNSTSVETVVFDSSFADARPTSCYKWFYGMSNLTTIMGIENLKTDEVTSMFGMFYNCSGLKSLDLSGFNTAKVNSMQSMFYNCSSLTSLDVSEFNTAKVTNMNYMFYGCSSLKSLDVSRFNTSIVVLMNNMFYGCSSLTSLDLSGFTFTKGSGLLSSTTGNLLKNCYGLKTLTVSETADNLHTNACSGVGTEDAPCVLIYPSGTELTKTEETGSYFVWKSGYFKENNILPGDANEDGHVTVADVMLTVNKVLGKTLTTFNETSADVNSDGKITVSDVMGIVKIVLSGGGNSSAPSNAFFSFTDGMALTANGSELTLHLTGTGIYTASQMTLTLPEGCRLESAQMVASRSNGHSVLTSDLGNGHYRVVIYSASGLPFGPSCTDLLRLRVAGYHNGDVALSDIQVVDPLTDTVLLSDVSGIATGIDGLGTDASSDGDWYTTQGQRVSTPTRGVYIRNGRKVVVK